MNCRTFSQNLRTQGKSHYNHITGSRTLVVNQFIATPSLFTHVGNFCGFPIHWSYVIGGRGDVGNHKDGQHGRRGRGKKKETVQLHPQHTIKSLGRSVPIVVKN